MKSCAGKLHEGSHLSLGFVLNRLQPSQTAALHFSALGTNIIVEILCNYETAAI